MKGKIVFGAFDGMSCGQIALKDLGIKVDKYYSSEIDKYAIAQTQHNFKETIQLGDITAIKAKDLDKIDFFIGGSPCQGFSFAGRQLNFEDPRSSLFFEYVRLWNEIKEINPNAKFLLENVNMKKEYLRVISEYLGVFPVRINSNLVSAQNRDRWYWTNIRTKETGLFSELWSDIRQPKNKGVFLKDVLQPENEIEDKYYIKNKSLKGLNIYNKAPTQRSSSGRCIDDKHNYQIIKLDKQLNKKLDQGKASCFTAGGNSGGNSGGNHSDMDIICVAMRGRNPENPNDRTAGICTEQRLEPKTDGKTNCLTSVAKDNLILQKAHGFNKGGVFKDKSPTLLGNSWEHNNYVTDNCKLRRLTPLECARLQTIPEWYEWIVSDYQRYKMLGNGWTVEVIKHIFSFLNWE